MTLRPQAEEEAERAAFVTTFRKQLAARLGLDPAMIEVHPRQHPRPGDTFEIVHAEIVIS